MRLVKFPKISLTLTVKEGDKDPETVPQTAQDLLLQALNIFRDERGQPTGPTMDDLEKRGPLREKIREAKGSVLLEKPEWELLCTVIKTHRWPWTHEDVLKVCHAVTKAEECEVEEKPNRAARRRQKKATEKAAEKDAKD